MMARAGGSYTKERERKEGGAGGGERNKDNQDLKDSMRLFPWTIVAPPVLLPLQLRLSFFLKHLSVGFPVCIHDLGGSHL